MASVVATPGSSHCGGRTREASSESGSGILAADHDPDEGAVSLDEYFELSSWISQEDGNKDDIPGCDPVPQPQEEQEAASYWDRADETGLFMETTAACFVSSDQVGDSWTLSAEEQSTVQIVLNITDRGMLADSSAINTLRHMQIPLLALDGIPESLQQTQVCLGSESPLFPPAGDGVQVVNGPGTPVDLMQEESSLSWTLTRRDEIVYEAADTIHPSVAIEEDVEEKKDISARSLASFGGAGREIIIRPRQDQDSLVGLQPIEEKNLVLDQAESVVDSCSFSINSSSSCCNSAVELNSAYNPEDRRGFKRNRSTRSMPGPSSSRVLDEDQELEIAAPKIKQSKSSGKKSQAKKKKNVPKLPATSVKILREWLAANVSDPYPTNDEKNELVTRTGLRMQQVESWMSNARAKFRIQSHSKKPSRVLCI